MEKSCASQFRSFTVLLVSQIPLAVRVHGECGSRGPGVSWKRNRNGLRFDVGELGRLEEAPERRDARGTASLFSFLLFYAALLP